MPPPKSRLCPLIFNYIKLLDKIFEGVQFYYFPWGVFSSKTKNRI